MPSGIIFDIKRFALHDGPGLRTTLFLKGCPLSCLSCHNPEGQRPGPELIFRVDRCTECGDCIPACPHQALDLSHGSLRVAWDRCELAVACVEACLPGALELVGKRRSVPDLLKLLEEDQIYFDESRGGVTLSGGEPFSQPDFLRALLHGCRERDLRVVLDTCGHVPPELFRELAPLASHLLFDLKLMDEKRHQDFTGVHNRWILENLEWAGNGFGGREDPIPDLTVRIPLVPGVNDDGENLNATARFICELTRSPKVDLLPYHRLGVAKYGGMGREYRLQEVAPPENEAVLLAVRILEEAGLDVLIRGEPHGHD